jgi:hypothetical protein
VVGQPALEAVSEALTSTGWAQDWGRNMDNDIRMDGNNDMRTSSCVFLLLYRRWKVPRMGPAMPQDMYWQ